MIKDRENHIREGIDDTNGLRHRSEDFEALEAEYHRMRHLLEERTHDLGERVKELNCLYRLFRLAEDRTLSSEQMYQEVVNLIPQGWQYPEITCARLILEGEIFIYKTDTFKETSWKQSADIVVFGDTIGTLQVFYREERPELDEGPFLKEERNLINAICQHLGEIIERKSTEQGLKESEQKLREQTVSLEHKNIALKEILERLEVEKKHINENIILNVEELLNPIIDKLEASGAQPKYIQLLRENVQTLTSTFGKRITETNAKLTPREIEICNMVKNGLRNKEIAQLLNISLHTTAKHRRNIRKKLGIVKKDFNLTSYLQKL